jgi:hypothetical protein
MALGSTQPLTEMNTSNLHGDKGRPARKADNLTAICEPNVWKMWEPRRLTTLWAFIACYRDSFAFFAYTVWTEKVGVDMYEDDSKSSRNVAISLYYVNTMIYKLNRLRSIFHLSIQLL